MSGAATDKSGHGVRSAWLSVLLEGSTVAGAVAVAAAIAIAVLVAVLARQSGDAVTVWWLQGFVILAASVFPAWLYIKFAASRAPQVYDEYVLNLHRLQMDLPQHLPRPPRNSVYYEPWKAGWADAAAAVAAAADPGGDHPLHDPNIYDEKWDAVFGSHSRELSRASGTQPPSRAQGWETLAPIMGSVAILAVGWAFLLSGDFEPGRLSVFDALRFAFLGSYLYIVQLLIRRYFQNDLKVAAYINGIARIAVAGGLTLLVHQFGLAPATEAAVAFTLGFLPLVALQTLHHGGAVVLRRLVQSLQSDFPLSDLDGMNVWYEARLLEEGVEDMQNLATCNLVDVLLRTRVPVGRLVDWIDQSHLYLHLPPPVRSSLGQRAEEGATGQCCRDQLRRHGVRTATDLEDVFTSADCDEFPALKALGGDEEAKAFTTAMFNVLPPIGAGAQPDGTSCQLKAILKSLCTEPNLKHVRAWRRDWGPHSPAVTELAG